MMLKDMYCTRVEDRLAILEEVLALKLDRIPDGSGASRGEGTEEGWISGLSMKRLLGPGDESIEDDLGYCPYLLMEVAETFNGRTVMQVMVNRLEAGTALKPHRDGEPEHDRYHLPVFTNPWVNWWDQYNGLTHMKLWHWYGPVPYCGVLHSMYNDGSLPRYHVVVDLEKVS